MWLDETSTTYTAAVKLNRQQIRSPQRQTLRQESIQTSTAGQQHRSIIFLLAHQLTRTILIGQVPKASRRGLNPLWKTWIQLRRHNCKPPLVAYNGSNCCVRETSRNDAMHISCIGIHVPSRKQHVGYPSLCDHQSSTFVGTTFVGTTLVSDLREF